MKYETVIGLEIHAELNTNAKLFTWTENRFGGEPNTRIDPITLGMPGVLPVLNKKAVDYTILAGIAMECAIQPYSKFDRKHYFYPDLPKGYQISQYDLPIAKDGAVEYDLDGETRSCRIRRIHLEEDAGKLIHAEGGANVSWVDYNRSCVPLIEIVGEPDLRSSDEAIAYWRAVKEILEYAEVSDCNMEEGSFRCDANISLRPVGSETLGSRAELKNMNSFKFVQTALEYEIRRQTRILDGGGTVDQETRLFDPAKGTTRAMRSKEEASDYRYFPEPDLVPLVIDDSWVKETRGRMPELPRARRKRLEDEYGVNAQTAKALTAEKAFADYYEETAKACGDPTGAANWVQGDLIGMLRAESRSIHDSPVKPEQLGTLIKMINDGSISGRMAKEALEEMMKTGKPAEQVVQERGFIQVSDESAIDKWARQVIEENPDAAEKIRAGNDRAIGFLVGQMMKLSRGKANPKLANAALRKALDE